MPHHFAIKLKTVAVVARFVFIVTALTSLTALAQKADTNQQLGTLSMTLAQGVAAALPAWQDLGALGTQSSQLMSWGGLETFGPFVSAQGSQGASLLPSASYNSGCLPWSVAVGDLNGDGHPDLVVSNWYQACNGVFGLGDVSVLLGNGDGTFQAPVTYASGGFQTLGVAVADLNRDGKLDIVVANACANDDATCSGQVAVLLGNGDGTFQSAVGYFSGGDQPYSVTIADVNGDGVPDVIAANSCTANPGGGCTTPGSAGILLGNGDGTFQPGVPYPSDPNNYLVALALGDLNGDGYPDVVTVGGQGPGVISVLLGSGDGTFQPEVSYDSGGNGPDSVAIADVNGDGHSDVIVASDCLDPNKNCNHGSVTVLLGKGDGTLRGPVNYSVGGVTATSVAVADIDGDGNPDLIVSTIDPNGSSDGGPGEVGVLLGNGDGTFRAPKEFPSGGGTPWSVVVADVNGDKKPDVLVTNLCANGDCGGFTPGSVGVLLNNAGTPQAPSTTALACSPTQSGYGQTVTCTAAVNSSSTMPNGTVILYDLATPIGSAPVVKRRAVIPVSALAVGSHSLMAVYKGASNFAPSTSKPLTASVVAASTTVSLTSSSNPALVGQAITYTARVIGEYGGGTATGTMTFKIGTAKPVTVAVTDNQATVVNTYPLRGVRSVTATYSGDSNNGASVSPLFNEAIAAAYPYPSHTTIATSGSPSLLGQPVTFTATVSFVGNAVPNGELVHFYNGSMEMSTGATTNGVATFATSSLAAKTHTIRAVYEGDGTLGASTSGVKQVVNP